mmetsp:Transcript_13680/g.40660  ORF Transcript_13680/g.40660 Transcript_13680/m.40660 type:complete len:283 (+) Transcript_13680:715-1563(+)
MTKRLSGEKDAESTGPECPSKVQATWKVRKTPSMTQTLALESSDAVTTHFKSGVAHAELTAASCPVMVSSQAPEAALQTFAVQSAEQVRIAGQISAKTWPRPQQPASSSNCSSASGGPCARRIRGRSGSFAARPTRRMATRPSTVPFVRRSRVLAVCPSRHAEVRPFVMEQRPLSWLARYTPALIWYISPSSMRSSGPKCTPARPLTSARSSSSKPSTSRHITNLWSLSRKNTAHLTSLRCCRLCKSQPSASAMPPPTTPRHNSGKLFALWSAFCAMSNSPV